MDRASGSRSKYRAFSLKSLLAFVAILCLIVGHKVTVQRRQQAARTALGQFGQIIFRHQWTRTPATPVDYRAASPGPRWLRNIIGDDYFQQIEVVTLSQSMVTSTPTSGTSDCTDRDLESLVDLPDIGLLEIESRFVTDDGMQSVGTLNRLEMLTLKVPQLTDEGLVVLAGCSALKQIVLIGTKVTLAGAAKLKQALPSALVVVDGQEIK